MREVDALVASLQDIVPLDGAVRDLADLPVGSHAWRTLKRNALVQGEDRRMMLLMPVRSSIGCAQRLIRDRKPCSNRLDEKAMKLLRGYGVVLLECTQHLK
jgi:hypothetical protein